MNLKTQLMEPIAILLDEKRNLRSEITSLNKTIYSTLFTSFAIIGGLGGYLIGKSGLNEFLINKDYLIFGFIVSQIVFVLAIFILSLNSSIVMISAYLSTLDNKINVIKKERLLSWELEARHLYNSFNDVPFLALIIIYLFFSIIFLFSIRINWGEYKVCHNNLYLKAIFLQAVEILIIGYIIFRKHREYKRVKDYFDKLDSGNTVVN